MRPRLSFRFALLAVPALLALVAAAGCGGSSTLSHDELTSKADAACAQANAKTAALDEPHGTQGLVAYLTQTEQIVHGLHDEIAGLDASAEDEQALAKYLRALAKADATIEEMANAARSENEPAVEELAGSIAAAQIGPLAAKAGLETCASPPAAHS